MYIFQEPSGSLFILIPVIDKAAERTVLPLLCQVIQHGNEVVYLDAARHPRQFRGYGGHQGLLLAILLYHHRMERLCLVADVDLLLLHLGVISTASLERKRSYAIIPA